MATTHRADDVQFHIEHPEWATARPGMRARVKHRIELVRHGQTVSNKRLTDSGDFSVNPDPVLTPLGWEQAEEIAAFYKELFGRSRVAGGWAPEDKSYIRIGVSPLQRTLDTAAPTLRAFAGLPGTETIDTNLRERWNRDGAWVDTRELGRCGQHHTTGTRWWYPKESYGEFRRRVHAKVDEWMAQGSAEDRCHTIVFGHSLFINTVLTHFLPAPADDDTEVPQFFHLPNGSITVIDIDTENKMHVHCVGFTEHLRLPTGQHTAHVGHRSQAVAPAAPAAPPPSPAPVRRAPPPRRQSSDNDGKDELYARACGWR